VQSTETLGTIVVVPVRDKLPRFRAPKSGSNRRAVPLSIRFRRLIENVRRFRFTRKIVDNIIGVFGELLMTAGVFVLLFLGWHVWYNDIVSGIAQDNAGAALAEQWNDVPVTVPEFDRTQGTSAGIAVAPEPPVTKAPNAAERFATMLIPRFGPTFERAIAVGIDPKTVLNIREAGIGYYQQSSELGQIGNFAVAGHRTTYGAPFGDIAELRVGDRIYIETDAGWYVYRFRNLEYVWPNNTRVLRPVPETSIKAKDRILTMTSCHPKLSAAERIIAYSVFETFVPRELGAPSEVAAIKAAG
jgi:sortase A